MLGAVTRISLGLIVIVAFGCAPSLRSDRGAQDFAQRLPESSCQKIGDLSNARQVMELVASDPMSRVPSSFTSGIMVPLDRVRVMPDYSSWRDAACQFALGDMDAETHQEWEQRYAQMRDSEHRIDAEAAYQKAKTMAHDVRLQTPDTAIDPSLQDDTRLKQKFGVQ
jgi:hypothetical protein